MNHADPDEMHDTNETKTLREEGDGLHAWLLTAKCISSLRISNHTSLASYCRET